MQQRLAQALAAQPHGAAALLQRLAGSGLATAVGGAGGQALVSARALHDALVGSGLQESSDEGGAVHAHSLHCAITLVRALARRSGGCSSGSRSGAGGVPEAGAVAAPLQDVLRALGL